MGMKQAMNFWAGWMLVDWEWIGWNWVGGRDRRARRARGFDSHQLSCVLLLYFRIFLLYFRFPYFPIFFFSSFILSHWCISIFHICIFVYLYICRNGYEVSYEFLSRMSVGRLEFYSIGLDWTGGRGRGLDSHQLNCGSALSIFPYRLACIVSYFVIFVFSHFVNFLLPCFLIFSFSDHPTFLFC
jgi:hypothetical protein